MTHQHNVTDSMEWFLPRVPSEWFLPVSWAISHQWRTKRTWLLGGALALDLHSNCARVVGSRTMMRTSEYELVIPFSLLGVNPEEMDDFDELWRTVELKMMTRFYLTACYKKIGLYENYETERNNLHVFQKWVDIQISIILKKVEISRLLLKDIQNVILVEQF